MVGYPLGLGALGQRFQSREIVEVDRVDTADGQRYAVHHHRIALTHAVEVVQRLAARNQIVFRDQSTRGCSERICS